MSLLPGLGHHREDTTWDAANQPGFGARIALAAFLTAALLAVRRNVRDYPALKFLYLGIQTTISASQTSPTMPSHTYTVSIDVLKYTVSAETRIEARWFAAHEYVRYQYGSAAVDPSAFALKADIVDAPSDR